MSQCENLICFDKLSLESWKIKYRDDIRVINYLDNVDNCEVGVLLADNKTKMFFPRYNKKGWLNGKAEKASIGDKLIMIRIPALKYNNKYLILDGLHRITGLRPKLIILDYLVISEKDRKMFADLTSEFFNN